MSDRRFSRCKFSERKKYAKHSHSNRLMWCKKIKYLIEQYDVCVTVFDQDDGEILRIEKKINMKKNFSFLEE